MGRRPLNLCGCQGSLVALLCILSESPFFGNIPLDMLKLASRSLASPEDRHTIRDVPISWGPKEQR